MLRECCRYEELTKLILNSEQFYKFFEYVEFSTFDIASDAFLVFRVSQQPQKLQNEKIQFPKNFSSKGSFN